MRPGLAAGAVLFLSFFALVTCSDSPSELEPPEATTIELSASTLEVDDGGSRSLSATVRDQYGEPMPGAVVEWSSTDAAIASVADGLVTGNYPGETTVQATSGSAVAAATVVVLRVPTGMELVSGADQQGTVGEALPDSIAVRVLDRHDEAVPGATVRFAPSSGSGGVGATEVATGADGIAATDWTLGTAAGEQGLEITCDRLTTVVHEVRAVALAAAPDRVAVVGGNGQVGTVAEALTDSIAVQVFDEYDNPVPGAVVAWDPEDVGAAIHPVVSTAAEDGIARASWTLGTVAGAQSTQAVIGSVAAAVLNATARPGAPNELVVIRGSDQTLPVGTVADTLAVKAVDRWGNGIEEIAVEWVVTLGGGDVTPSPIATNALGVAATQWTLGPQKGEQVVRARSHGIPEVLFRAEAVNSPAAIYAVDGDGQAGVYGDELPTPLVVYVADAFMNPVEGARITWEVTSGNGLVSPGYTRTDATGLAYTRWTVGTTGMDSVEATVWADEAYSTVFSADVRQKAVYLELRDTVIKALGDTVGVSLAGWDVNGERLAKSTWLLATWSSSDPEVMTAASGGIVVSRGNGEAVLRAELDGVVATADVRVRQEAATIVPFADSIMIRVREKVPLLFTVYDARGREMPATLTTYSSSYPVAASVVQGPALAGHYPAPATIELQNGAATAEIEVMVIAGEAITAGDSHTCAIAPSGQAYCWGLGVYGQLGNGIYGSVSAPDVVLGGLLFRQISAGGSHTCGVTTDDRLFCWGDNQSGTLGTGGTGTESEPVFVMPGVASVSSGSSHTCALALDGRAWCWGWGALLGLGLDPNAIVRSPAEVFGDLRFARISAGGRVTCGIDKTGSAYCWGLNDYGQLGDLTLEPRYAPTPVYGERRYIDISAGFHHVCAIDERNRVYCWGENAYGQLGDGSGTNQLEPVRVELAPVASVDGAFIAAGWDHTCVLTTDEGLYCWGRNVHGQLGDGSNITRETPVQINVLPIYSWVDAGRYHTCALLLTGAAYCWGWDSNGQLGIAGEGGESWVPVPVQMPPGVIFAWIPPEPAWWQRSGPVASIDD